jgi:hypothetical protein
MIILQKTWTGHILHKDIENLLPSNESDIKVRLGPHLAVDYLVPVGVVGVRAVRHENGGMTNNFFFLIFIIFFLVIPFLWYTLLLKCSLYRYDVWCKSLWMCMMSLDYLEAKPSS